MIPDGWQKSELGSIANVTSGGTPNRSNKDYWGGLIPWITTGEINFNLITESREFIMEEGLKNSSAKLFPKNTILMAMYGQGLTRGRVAILGIEATTNQACCAIMIDKNNDYLFAYYFLENNYDAIREMAHGGNQKNLSGELVKSIPILLPPLEEQRKIAAILSTWDEAIGLVEALIGALGRRKQALMQLLLTGEVRFAGFAGANTKQSTIYGEIPTDWSMQNLNIYCDKVTDGTHDTPQKQKNGIPLITSKNLLQDGTIDFSTATYISQEDFALIDKRSGVNTNDVLFGMIGTIGNPAIVYDSYPMFAIKNVALFRFGGDFIRANWLRFILGSSQFEQIIQENQSGNAQKFLPLNFLREVKIPVPKRDEQEKIIEVLRLVDHEIDLLNAQMHELRIQKRGLMQQLLTGTVRV